MSSFTPVSALAGGALIGVAATVLLFFSGRVAGISGVLAGVLRPAPGQWRWRAAFLVGLLAGGAALAVTSPGALGASPRSGVALGLAGLLVGFGARLGGGCTSGHGICGLSRLSRRSLVATLTFITTGIATVAVARLLSGATP
jgi:uncharacterized membrane protein YedE/YeeE